MWPSMLLLWVPSLLMRPQMTAMSTRIVAGGYSGLGEFLPLLILFYVAAFILIFMQLIGISQLALEKHEGPVWFYFSLSRPLWRLVGSFLLLLVVMTVGWIAVILCDVVLGVLVKFVLTGANPLLAAVAGILTIVIMSFLGAHFSMASSASHSFSLRLSLPGMKALRSAGAGH